VRSVGGNYAKIDSIRTKYEMQTYSESYTYSCGKNQSCSGSRPVTREVGTTQILGRAFRIEAS
jgi:hypothetical protein